MNRLIRVALDVPVPRLFDYRCDDVAAVIGARVLVPFGRQRLIGLIVAQPETSDVPENKLRHALSVLDREALLQQADLKLLEFAADYYVHPLGAVVMATLPAALRRISTRSKSPGAWTLTEEGRALHEDALPPRARAQRRLLGLLREQAVLPHTAITAAGTATGQALKVFIAEGWVTATDAPSGEVAVAQPPGIAPQLTPDQASAVEAITAALGRYQSLLLLGITGSGKTEVYLHAMAIALSRGQQVLLLVPEIALTPQLESLVIARFPEMMVSTLHSGLADGERAERWQAARSGQARIVLGTRLSVFTPLRDLGLIIVDEEHDSSFKQGEGFRYSARDLAVVRASQANVPIVLGSATPALETYRNALDGRYQLLPLKNRIQAALPAIHCVDLRQQKAEDGLSPALISAIRERIARNEQSMVFINRRGYAPVLMCGSCGWMSDCERCSAKLVLHLRDRRLRCHHCGHDSAVPTACPDCGDADLAPVGQGTQRVEEALIRHFPQARILRIDRDTTRPKDAWPAMRERIRERDVDILVGTQILAKGHHFERVTLVGVLNADSGLFAADYRASERLFAQLQQVSGRSGRASLKGEVLIQTRYPAHPLYQALVRNDYAGFADTLLAERETAGFPPYVHEAVLRAESREPEDALGFLARAIAAAPAPREDITLYDPAPMSLARLSGWERAQVVAQSASRRAMQLFLTEWNETLATMPDKRVRWHFDVDPIEY